MSQSGSASDRWSTADQPIAQLETSLTALEVGLDVELTVTPTEYQALLDELTQAQNLDQERLTRIRDLEQALDQALACLSELRSNVRDQTILETQLASTEEFASVQQQAIAQLKRQLADQQKALDAQILETQQRDQAIQELLATIEGMTQVQQQELERLKTRIAHDQVEIQTNRNRLGKQLQDLQIALESRQQRVSKLESETLATRTLNVSLQEQLEAAHQQIKELSASLCQYRVNLTQLTHLEQTQVAIGERHNAALSPYRQSVEPELSKAQHRIEELEEQLNQRSVQQSRWQHTHQELETERDRLQQRVAALEQQVAEMQEQILQQAQQAIEQETAIQYWKDRYAASHRQSAHLRDLLDQVLVHHSADLGEAAALPAELFAALKGAITPDKPEPLSLPSAPIPRLSTVELPEFLVRRRSQNPRG